MSLTVHEFYQVLGDAIASLDKAKGADEQVNTAQRRLNDLNTQIAALADAHAKLKADSDAHLAANLAKFNEETVKHNNEVEARKKQLAALDELHRTQQENASNTLTHLNAQIGVAKHDVDRWSARREQLKNEAIEYAKSL